MIRKTLLLITLLTGIKSYSQSPVGTVVNNFTLTDINGNIQDLYSYLDSGKIVVINVSAAWCGPCWSYENTSALNDFYLAHGPSGVNDAMVFFVEGDPTTTSAELNGTGGNTQGDWVTGAAMPIIDLATTASFENSGMSIDYFPEMYVICPNRTILASGVSGMIGTMTSLNSYIGQCPPPPSYPLDVSVLSYEGDPVVCDMVSYIPIIKIQNNGIDTLNSATILITQGGNTISTGTYSGNLITYGVASVSCSAIANFTGGILTATVTTNGDADASNNTITAPISAAIEASTCIITVDITTDQYASETSWNIKNDIGAVVASGGGSWTDLSAAGATVQTPVNVTLNPTQCYTFEIYDAYGDGICCTQGNGVYTVKDANGSILGAGGEFTDFETFPFKTGVNNLFSLSVTICGGDIYNWNGQQYTQPGQYSQTLTNQFGYDSVVTLTLNVNTNDNISITPNPAFGNAPLNVAFANQTANLSNYNFTWYFGDGTSQQSNAPFLSHIYTQDGYADVTVVADNLTTGCSSSQTFNDLIFVIGGVTCTHTATLNQTSALTGCVGDYILLSSNTDPSFTYQWNKNGIPVSGATSSLFYPTQSGSYTVTIYQNNCPVTSAGISVTFNPLPSVPTISSSGNITPCSGGSITLTAPSGLTSYLWNTGSTASSLVVSQSGNYSVTVTNSNGCSQTSNPFAVNASFMAAPQVCIVGVDSLTNENRVVWEKPLTLGIDSFYVYKETNVSNVYTKIGATDYNQLAVFLDVNSNPAVQAYRYKISAKDTCGVETNVGDFHKTIHLTINQGIGGAWNLIWSHYEGLNFGSYNIYRGTDPSNISLLTTIQSNLNSYTDLAPPTGPLYYQIEVVNPVNCDPTKIVNYGVSRSNIVNNGVSGVLEVVNTNILVYPNPTNGNITLEVSSELVGKRYSIRDFSGRIIRDGKISSIQEHIDLQNVARGAYYLSIENSTSVTKLIKQ